MESLLITSPQNSLVKQLRQLHQARERHQQGSFLLEGTHLLQEACAAAYPLQLLCSTQHWQTQHPDLWQRAMAQAETVRTVTPAVLKAMATTVNPDGVIATAARTPGLMPTDALAIPETLSLGVVAERLQDPGNLGTIIRTLAAAGGDGLWLSADSVDPDHPKVLRASAGQWFRLPITVVAELPTLLASLSQRGIQVVATEPTATQSYWDLNLCQPTLLVLGNEGQGLSAATLAEATAVVKIPLATGVESLNVAIATALLLYEAQRQRRSVTPDPDERVAVI